MGAARPTLHLFCGKMAAGKSTLAQSLAKRPATVLIGEANWIEILYPGEVKTILDYSRCSRRLREVMGPHVLSMLKVGMSVALDFPANTIESRRWMRAIAEEAGAALELHVLEVADDVCKQRLQERNAAGTHAFQATGEEYEFFTSRFTPPSPEEQFNVIVHKE